MVGAKENHLVRSSAELIRRGCRNGHLRVVLRSGHDIPFTAPEELADQLRQLAQLARPGRPSPE